MKHEPINVTMVQRHMRVTWQEAVGVTFFFAVLFGLAVFL